MTSRYQIICVLGIASGIILATLAKAEGEEFQCLVDSVANIKDSVKQENAANAILQDFETCSAVRQGTCPAACSNLIGGPLISDECKYSIANSENQDGALGVRLIFKVCGIDLPSQDPQQSSGQRTVPASSQTAQAASQISTLALASSIGIIVLPLVVGFIGFD